MRSRTASRQVAGISLEQCTVRSRHKSRLDQKEGKRGLQARRAGKTRSQRHVADDGDVEFRGQDLSLCLLDRPDNSFYVIRPVARLAAFQILEVKGDVAEKIHGMRATRTPGGRASRDHGEAVDCDSHDQAAVVISVVAQQFDPPGRNAQRGGRDSELLDKGGCGTGFQFARG
jgi:hypothetical protein